MSFHVQTIKIKVLGINKSPDSTQEDLGINESPVPMQLDLGINKSSGPIHENLRKQISRSITV